MIIDYRKPKAGPLSLPMVTVKTKARKGPNAGREAAHRNVKVKVLIPGINEIADDVWNELRNIKQIQRYLEDGHIVEKYMEVQKDAKDKVIAVKATKTFYDLEEDEQEALVAETFDLKLLEKWRKKSNSLIKGKIDDYEDDVSAECLDLYDQMKAILEFE